MVAHQRFYFWTFSIRSIFLTFFSKWMYEKEKKIVIFGKNHHFITYILIPESIRKKEEMNSMTLLLHILFCIDPNSFHLQKILLLPPKKEIIMVLFYHSNSQYCDSNIGKIIIFEGYQKLFRILLVAIIFSATVFV